MLLSICGGCEKVYPARNILINSMTVTHDDSYMRRSAFFKIPLLAQGLTRLLTMLFHTIVLSWVIELPFRNSRADWKISEVTNSYKWTIYHRSGKFCC